MCGDVLRVMPVIRSMNASIWNSNNIVGSEMQHHCLAGLSDVRYIDLWNNRLWPSDNICAWNVRNNAFMDTGLPMIEGDTLYLTWYGSYGIIRDGVAATLPNLAGRSLEERKKWFDRTSLYITPLRNDGSTGQITKMYGEELRNKFLTSLGLDGEMQSISQLDLILDNVSDPEPKGIYGYRGTVNNYGSRNRGDSTTFGISHYPGENQVTLDPELVRRLSLILDRLDDDVLDTLDCTQSSCALSEPSVQTLINKVEQYKHSLLSLKRTEDQRSVQLRNREDLEDSYGLVPDSVLPDVTKSLPKQRLDDLPRTRSSQCFTGLLYSPCEDDSQCNFSTLVYIIYAMKRLLEQEISAAQ